MARMHGRAKGKSGSTRPITKTAPSWMRYKPKEIEMLIVKQAKENQTASQIGIHLRDTYGIPDASFITGKSISQIMKERKVYPEVPEDLMALMRRALAVRKHFEENKQDKSSLRGIQLTESKIRRLVKYYKKSKVLPANWNYDPAKLKLFVQ